MAGPIAEKPYVVCITVNAKPNAGPGQRPQRWSHRAQRQSAAAAARRAAARGGGRNPNLNGNVAPDRGRLVGNAVGRIHRRKRGTQRSSAQAAAPHS